ncbi:hypothetical protein SADUNF_Sadunf01G0162200 [Salix dunnii]|uniref:CHCH domain-containing protein n=1 Tax=Salix dunnii TaxID=1413687 RepID=A0A835NC65_9ROSI|nr:hypothetical protein SADUNF_Sadunf01G0162200 [Salix dunnii]
MSAGGAFGGNRGLRPVPPEKGIFPLDHMHECDLEKKDYLNCLKSSGHQSEKCRLFSKKYLECRMEKQVYWVSLLSLSDTILVVMQSILTYKPFVNLMAKQEISELGFGKISEMDASGEKPNEKINN